MNGIRAALMKRNKENLIRHAIKTGKIDGLTMEDIRSVDPRFMRDFIARAYRQMLEQLGVDYLEI